MDLVNATELPGQLVSGSTTDLEMLGTVGCKATYLVEDGKLELADPDDQWPIFDKEYVYEGVSLGPELDFRKSGLDVIVFGSAVAPGGEPVERMVVAIQCGDLDHRILVTGDREWVRSGGRLVPSDPTPFATMPLTNDRAFGGSARLDGQEIPSAINPEGTGYYLDESRAEGRPLPNLEVPDDQIARWDQYPRPACIYRPSGWLGQAEVMENGIDAESAVSEIMSATFDQTVPELVTSTEEIGDLLHLTGFTEEGQLTLPVPSVAGPVIDVRVGELSETFDLSLATLVVLVEERVIIATYVRHFRYLFQPGEQRRVKLDWPRLRRDSEAPVDAVGSQP